jgi:hypothetical protein
MSNNNNNMNRRSLRIYQKNMNQQLQDDSKKIMNQVMQNIAKNADERRREMKQKMHEKQQQRALIKVPNINLNKEKLETTLGSNQNQTKIPVVKISLDFMMKSIKQAKINSQMALKSIRETVSNYPQTNQCIGNDITKWFKTLFDKKLLHQNIKITNLYHLEISNHKYFIDPIIQVLKDNPNDNIIIPLGFENHSNLIFVNRKLCIVEWFEPHGDLSGSAGYEFKRNFLLNDFMNMFEIPINYKIAIPYDQCPVKLGPQSSAERKDKKCLIGGYCLTYSTIYAHLRCLTSQVDPSETIQILQTLSDEENIDLVRRYIGWQNDLGHKDNYILMGNTKENSNKRKETIRVKKNSLYEAFKMKSDSLYKTFKMKSDSLFEDFEERNRTIVENINAKHKKNADSLNQDLAKNTEISNRELKEIFQTFNERTEKLFELQQDLLKDNQKLGGLSKIIQEINDVQKEYDHDSKDRIEKNKKTVESLYQTYNNKQNEINQEFQDLKLKSEKKYDEDVEMNQKGYEEDVEINQKSYENQIGKIELDFII